MTIASLWEKTPGYLPPKDEIFPPALGFWLRGSDRKVSDDGRTWRGATDDERAQIKAWWANCNA